MGMTRSLAVGVFSPSALASSGKKVGLEPFFFLPFGPASVNNATIGALTIGGRPEKPWRAWCPRTA